MTEQRYIVAVGALIAGYRADVEIKPYLQLFVTNVTSSFYTAYTANSVTCVYDRKFQDLDYAQVIDHRQAFTWTFVDADSSVFADLEARVHAGLISYYHAQYQNYGAQAVTGSVGVSGSVAITNPVTSVTVSNPVTAVQITNTIADPVRCSTYVQGDVNITTSQSLDVIVRNDEPIPVSGIVAVSNPATAVTVTNVPHVIVDNPVSSVTVLNPVTAVSVSNIPHVKVDGSVSVVQEGPLPWDVIVRNSGPFQQIPVDTGTVSVTGAVSIIGTASVIGAVAVTGTVDIGNDVHINNSGFSVTETNPVTTVNVSNTSFQVTAPAGLDVHLTGQTIPMTTRLIGLGLSGTPITDTVPVSGTVAATGFPTSVAVTSLPAITGSVEVTNPTTSVAVSSLPPITGSVAVTNPTTSVAVSSLPPISGTVSVSGTVVTNDVSNKTDSTGRVYNDVAVGVTFDINNTYAGIGVIQHTHGGLIGLCVSTTYTEEENDDYEVIAKNRIIHCNE